MHFTLLDILLLNAYFLLWSILFYQVFYMEFLQYKYDFIIIIAE